MNKLFRSTLQHNGDFELYTIILGKSIIYSSGVIRDLALEIIV